MPTAASLALDWMAFTYCRKHHRADPWGCRECLREDLLKGIEADEADNAKMRRDAKPDPDVMNIPMDI